MSIVSLFYESTGGLGVSKKQSDNSDNSGHSSNAMIRVFGAPSTSVEKNLSRLAWSGSIDIKTSKQYHSLKLLKVLSIIFHDIHLILKIIFVHHQKQIVTSDFRPKISDQENPPLLKLWLWKQWSMNWTHGLTTMLPRFPVGFGPVAKRTARVFSFSYGLALVQVLAPGFFFKKGGWLVYGMGVGGVGMYRDL